MGAGYAITLAPARPRQIILLARTAAKVQPVIDQIKSISPQTEASFVSVSLDDIDSAKIAAREVSKVLIDGKLDVLINNAGIMAVPYSETKQGVESQFGTNHIGHFALTQGLISNIAAAGPEARVINITSDGYKIAKFKPESYNFDDGKTYDPFSGYGQSKTANILFTRGLASRGITSFAVHPGVIFGTALGTHLEMDDFAKIEPIAKRNTGQSFSIGDAKSAEQGVSTGLRAALDPGLVGANGSYLADGQVEELRDYAKDPAVVEKLWSISEELIGERFTI